MLRIPKIKQGLRDGLSYDQIAASCNLKSSQTIDRDMRVWVESGLFDTWLKTEFVSLYSHMKLSDPKEAFREVSKLVGKMITRKVESQHIERVEEIKLIWNVTDTKNKVLSS